MSDIVLKPYTADIIRDGVKLSDSSGKFITYAPAEARNIIDFVVTASGMFRMKVLPDKLKASPLQIEFTAEGLCTLSREDRDESVQFDLRTVDALIKIINLAVDKVVDGIRIQGGARAGVSTLNTPDPIIEGR
jgi:hypothetical protein